MGCAKFLGGFLFGALGAASAVLILFLVVSRCSGG